MSEKEDTEKGIQVRRWIRYHYDVPAQLEHTEDKYELVRDDFLPHNWPAYGLGLGGLFGMQA